MLVTDEAFCGGGGGVVRRLMERRRRHEECAGDDGEGGGCEILVGRRCGGGGGGVGGGEGGRGGGMSKGMIGRGRFHHGTRMAGVDPKLVLLAVLIAVFSFLVNVVVGMRLYHCVKFGWA